MKRINKILFIIAVLMVLKTGFNLFSQEYYHRNQYNFGNQDSINFHIFGTVVLKQVNETSDNAEYYFLQLYEPITFFKGNESVTVTEIQLVFNDKENIKNINLDWGGHIVNGRLYFSESGYYFTPVILVVDRIVING
ncbi:MAG: DUF4431 domain-containing protein [Treponema sp.]|nr:DUF4431 domain-containing protein [Treponema sp.]